MQNTVYPVYYDVTPGHAPSKWRKNPKTAEVCSQVLYYFKCVYFFPIRIEN